MLCGLPCEQHSKVALWQATIVENALKRLAALNKPFKYVGGSLLRMLTSRMPQHLSPTYVAEVVTLTPKIFLLLDLLPIPQQERNM